MAKTCHKTHNVPAPADRCNN